MKKTEKKVISITLVMVMLLAMLIPSISSAATGEVTIKDSKLKEVIAEQVDANKDGKITEEEMKNVTGITIPEGVTDLTGLEYAENLHQVMIVYGKTMPDLSVLQLKYGIEILLDINSIPEDHTVKLDFLKTIKSVDLSLTIENRTRDTYIELDCKDLKEITNLTGLSLNGAYPADMKSIYECSNLVSLSIVASQPGPSIDLNGIGNLKKLDYLVIDHADVFNFSEVGKLDSLRWFYIHYLSVEDESYLNFSLDCKDLAEVTIENTNITDISFLKNNQTLEHLSVINSPIKHMDDRKTLLQLIPTLPNLQSLYIDVDGMKLESLEAYKEWEAFFTYKGDEEEGQNSNDNNTAKTPTDSKTEAKTETKSQAKKPTWIPQAGINVVGNAISILVAISVFLLASIFVKAKRK